MSRPHSLLRSFAPWRSRLVAVALVGLAVPMIGTASAASPTTTVAQRVDLRVLVVDNGTPWIAAMESELTVEGVPFTTLTTSSPTRETITSAFLATGTEAHFQAVVLPDSTGVGLSADEVSAVRAYEAQFGVREVDMYTSTLR